jgi:hypothetical protein
MEALSDGIADAIAAKKAWLSVATFDMEHRGRADACKEKQHLRRVRIGLGI